MNMIPLDSFKINTENPRNIAPADFKALKKSLNDFPEMMEKNQLVIKSWEDRTLLRGNQRVPALKELGYTEIPESWVLSAEGWSEEQMKEFLIKDNHHAGTWNMVALSNWNVPQLQEWGLNLNFVTTKEVKEDGFVIPKKIETDFELGDLFEIGQHRLLCGSSTDRAAVARLLNGAEPYLMVTDPPYGVQYDAAWRDQALSNGKETGRAKGKVNNDGESDWSLAYELSPAKVAYVYHADKYSGIVQTNLEKNDFQIRAQIIWVKSHFPIGRGDYHHKHEPCWYAVKKGHAGKWISDRKQTTVWEIDKPQKNETGHSTQKPVECMARPVSHHEGNVHDPFIGSGTTMVAAHQLDRICYGMELDPKYCQLVVDRMKMLDKNIVIKRNGKLL